jgi:hypothetical protein
MYFKVCHLWYLENWTCVALPPASMQSWILAQIRLERICINPKGVMQDSLARIPAGMTNIQKS